MHIPYESCYVRFFHIFNVCLIISENSYYKIVSDLKKAWFTNMYKQRQQSVCGQLVVMGTTMKHCVQYESND